MGLFDVSLVDERSQLDAFVAEYRGALEPTLPGSPRSRPVGTLLSGDEVAAIDAFGRDIPEA